MWEKNTDQLLPACTLTRDLILNSGVCPDQESKPLPFGLQINVQPTEPHQLGLNSFFKSKHGLYLSDYVRTCFKSANCETLDLLLYSTCPFIQNSLSTWHWHWTPTVLIIFLVKILNPTGFSFVLWRQIYNVHPWNICKLEGLGSVSSTGWCEKNHFHLFVK